MTVAQLSEHLTQEELVGWAAFYEIKSEDKEMGNGAVSNS